MLKMVFYIILAAFSGYLIALSPFVLPITLTVLCFGLFFIKFENKALYFVVFFLPFSFALNPAPDIDLSVNRLLIISLFLVWLANSSVRKRINIPFNGTTILLAIFLLLAAASILVAEETSWALRKLLVFISIFPLYFVVADISKSWNNARKIVCSMFVGAFFVSLIGIIQFFSQFIVGITPVFSFWANYISPYFYGINFGKLVVENPSWLVNIGGATYLRALSLFPDPHMFAFYLGLILPIVFSLIVFSFNRKDEKAGVFKRKNLFFFLFCVLLLTTGITFSRSGYIGIISALTAVIILSWNYLGRFSKFLIFAAGSSILIMVFFTTNPVSSRILSIADFGEGSNAGRLKIWQEAINIIDANLLTGVGIGNYSLVINPRADYRNSIYAHNTYLDIASEMGIFAMIAWILMFVWAIYKLIKIKSIFGNVFEKAIITGLVGSLVSFMVSSLADTAIYSPAVLGMLMAIFGLISGIDENVKAQTTNVNLNSK